MGQLKVWTNENARVEYFLEASLNVMVVVIFENNGSNYKKGVLWTGKGNLVVMSGRVHSLEWRRNREKFDVRRNEDCTLRTHLKFINSFARASNQWQESSILPQGCSVNSSMARAHPG